MGKRLKIWPGRGHMDAESIARSSGRGADTVRPSVGKYPSSKRSEFTMGWHERERDRS
jgi:hypothetical protein